MIKKTLLLLLLLIVCSCSETREIVSQVPIRVLVLGNSIVEASAIPNIGWNGNWGMAATSQEKDFCHLLAKNKGIQLTSKNIAIWEIDFNWDISPYVDAADKPYDYLVYRLGENVSDLQNYKAAMPVLINKFKGANTKVVVTGVCWWNEGRDEIAAQVAGENGYIYVSLKEMWDYEYHAREYENPEIAIHPNDKGMAFISDAIYKAIVADRLQLLSQ